MAISFDGMSHQELQALIEAAQKHSIAAAKEHINSVRDKITAILNKEGLMLAEVFGAGRAAKGSRKPVAAKYVNPANASQTWSGRGKRPAWFNDAVAKGASVDKLLIDGAASTKPAATKKVAAKKGVPAKAVGKVVRKAAKR